MLEDVLKSESGFIKKRFRYPLYFIHFEINIEIKLKILHKKIAEQMEDPYGNTIKLFT